MHTAITILIVIVVAGLVLGPTLWFFLRRAGVINTAFTVDPWSHGVTLKDVTSKSLSFDFPTGDGVHLIDKRGEPKGLAQMSMTFEITGNNPKFIAMEGGKAKVRLHFAGARLWTRLGADLKIGKQTFSAPLRPEYWQTVDGKMCDQDQAHINLFRQAVEREKSVGFTFGGETQGYAHGAGLQSGSATFHLLDFTP